MKDRRNKKGHNKPNPVLREIYCNEEKTLGLLVYNTLEERLEQVVQLENKYRDDQLIKQKNQRNRYFKYSRNKRVEV